MWYHPQIIQEWALMLSVCVWKLHPPEISEQIRAELRWTAAPYQRITHFTAENRHDTLKILAMMQASNIQLLYAWTKKPYESSACVWRCTCAHRLGKRKRNVLPCCSVRSTKYPTPPLKRDTNNLQAVQRQQPPHTGTSAQCCPGVCRSNVR